MSDSDEAIINGVRYIPAKASADTYAEMLVQTLMRETGDSYQTHYAVLKRAIQKVMAALDNV
jgi:hypothetical protein